MRIRYALNFQKSIFGAILRPHFDHTLCQAFITTKYPIQLIQTIPKK
jgi:hypothetical protein